MSKPDPKATPANPAQVTGNDYFGPTSAAAQANPVSGTKPSFSTAKPPLRYPIGSIDAYTDFMLFEELNYRSTYGNNGRGTIS